MHMLWLKSLEHSVNVRTNKCKLTLLEIISSLGVFFYYYYLVQNSIIYKFGPYQDIWVNLLSGNIPYFLTETARKVLVTIQMS
jgi:hypothetical protein